MPSATLDNYHFPIDPTSVSWDFGVKVSNQDTIGGKVVQVLGTRLGDMTVSGTFSSWEQSTGFLAQVEKWIDKQIEVAHGIGRVTGGQPLRFTFAPRNWDFHVYIKALTSQDGQAISLSAATYAPRWILTLFVVQDNTNLLRTIQDRFLARLMDGIGWKQSKYNGPLQEVDPASARALMEQDFQQAYGGG